MGFIVGLRNNTVTIKAVGDISPGDGAVNGFGVGAAIKRLGCQYPFLKLNDVLGETDFLIGNLEGVISERCREEALRFGGEPELAHSLRNVGFDILTVANNHVLDHGIEVFEETVRHCRQAGINICGLRGSGEFFSDPVILEVKEQKFGFLGYNWVGLHEKNNSDSCIASISDGLVNYSWDRNIENDRKARREIAKKNLKVKGDILKLKAMVDTVVLLTHWGYEWTIFPPSGVILEARDFIDTGADCIIGSHPHVSQGVEVYNGKVIAYSLGNFLFDPQPEKSFLGMVFECVFSGRNIDRYDYSAIYCDENLQPHLATEKNQRQFREKIDKSTNMIKSIDFEEELNDELVYTFYENAYNKRKIKKVKYLLFMILRNPESLKPITKKVLNLLGILFLRLKGNKVRW